MRVVADTNTVISGLLWGGPPRRVLEAARDRAIQLFTTSALLAELQDVLGRAKFARYLERAGVSAEELVRGYAALAQAVDPVPIDPVIADDPDDDEVLACALAARAERIVSGDRHLLDLMTYQGIRILTAGEFLGELPG